MPTLLKETGGSQGFIFGFCSLKKMGLQSGFISPRLDAYGGVFSGEEHIIPRYLYCVD